MTTPFATKQQAIDYGLKYINGKLKDTSPRKTHLGFPQDLDIEVYEIDVPDKEKGWLIGVNVFRETAWNVWVIAPNGWANRL